MKPTLIVYLDAFIEDYLSSTNTPYLWAFKEQNSFAKITPLFAYTGVEVTVMTGKLPDETNVWTRFKQGDELAFVKKWSFLPRKAVDYIVAGRLYTKGYSMLSKTFNIPLNKLHKFSPAMKEAPCMRDDSFFANKTFVYYSYPLLIRNKKVSLLPRITTDKEKVERFVKEFSRDIELYWIQLVELDKVQHEFGVLSKEALLTAHAYDKHAKKVVESFKEVHPEGDILFWADHEFVHVKGEVKVPVTDDCFLDSTMARYWGEKPDMPKEGHFLTDEEKKKYHVPLGKEWGDHIFVLDLGYVITPNFWNTNQYKGMHGYLPDAIPKYPVCMTTKKLKSDKIEMRDIFEVVQS